MISNVTMLILAHLLILVPAHLLMLILACLVMLTKIPIKNRVALLGQIWQCEHWGRWKVNLARGAKLDLKLT